MLYCSNFEQYKLVMNLVILFGGGDLMASILTKLKKNKNYCPFVIVSKRHIREKVLKHGTFFKFLKKSKIDFIVAKKIDYLFLANKIKNHNSIGISLGSPWIFNSKIIELFNNRLYNIHSSNLPEDRGGGGFSWQILQGKIDMFMTLHNVLEKIDDGKIIIQKKISLKKDKSPLERQILYVKVATHQFMKNLKNLFNSKKIKGKKQDNTKATYWPRINTEIHGWIDWNWDGHDIYKFIKAFDNPYYGAHTQIEKKTYYLKNCIFVKAKKKFHPFQSGIIFNKTKNYILISVNGGVLKVKEVFNSKRKKVNFINIKLGQRFHTSFNKLEKAKKTRVFFNL